MNKYSTNVPGLDLLFHGGLQIDNSLDDMRKCNASSTTNDGNVKKEESGTVIIIRGDRGVNKTCLAMQMMHGLYCSLHDAHPNDLGDRALFYSIHNESKSLNDSYLDMIIARVMQDIVRQYRFDRFSKESVCDGVNNRTEIETLINFLFDIENSGCDNRTRREADLRNERIGKDLPRMICEGIVVYNHRTNALHYKRTFSKDDFNNIIASRRYDTITEYIEYLKSGENSRLLNCENKVINSFIRNLLSVSFNPDEISGENLRLDVPRNSMTIFKAIETDIYGRNFPCDILGEDEHLVNRGQPNPTRNDEDSNKKKYDLIVIDGFSQLSNEDLQGLPYSSLINQLKRLSNVSILVFDNREAERFDGDVVIEMHEQDATQEEYMYHELRIVKSSFQTSVLGWHQFKKRDYGIEVFPSTHLLLSKRFYISNKSQQMGMSLFESNYDQYLEAKAFEDCIQGSIEDCPVQTPYEEFLRSANSMSDRAMENAFKEYEKAINNVRVESEAINSGIRSNEMFSELVLHSESLKRIELATKHSMKECRNCNTSVNEWNNHFPATAIVGNPNSYKRTLALASAYNLAKKGIHTLFFLFDKDELEMRKRMVCPAYNGTKCSNDFSECKKCTKYLHTYDVRMGCLSAEEFFAVLLDQINFYCKPTEKNGVESEWMHIVIEDLQKIDFSFPFIKDTKLFLSTLIAICHSHKVMLTILCDKSASLAHEVCTLADRVLAIRRQPEDIYNIEINVERGCESNIPSRIMRFNLTDILHAFRCESDSMTIRDNNIRGELIGSVKDYWRKTFNTITNVTDLPDTGQTQH